MTDYRPTPKMIATLASLATKPMLVDDVSSTEWNRALALSDHGLAKISGSAEAHITAAGRRWLRAKNLAPA